MLAVALLLRMSFTFMLSKGETKAWALIHSFNIYLVSRIPGIHGLGLRGSRSISVHFGLYIYKLRKVTPTARSAKSFEEGEEVKACPPWHHLSLPALPVTADYFPSCSPGGQWGWGGFWSGVDALTWCVKWLWNKRDKTSLGTVCPLPGTLTMHSKYTSSQVF